MRKTKEKEMNKHRKIIIFTFIILVGLFLNKEFQWSSYLTDSNNLKAISNFVNDNYVMSVLLYLLFTIIGSSFLALPGVTFAVIGSGLFGPWLGSLYCLIGASLGATVSFLLSRYLLKDSIEELVKKNEKLYSIIFQANSEKEMLILMITRLLPIFPFNLQNFAYGITNISLVKYFMGTFLFMIPGIIIFSLGTDGIINSQDRNTMFLIVTIIVVLMVVLGIYLYKRYKKLTIGEINEG